MENFYNIQGVFAAVLTPLDHHYQIKLEDIPPLFDFLADRGCHGALLFGTTGEGPSFSVDERILLMRIAAQWRKTRPDFRLLVGAGTPSLEETCQITRAAFDLGMDGVVALPPYYYRNVPDEGLYLWFSQVIQRSVPKGRAFFGYHIPKLTGIPLSLGLLERLKETFPDRFAGIKDSSADQDHARALGEKFGDDLLVLNGTDPLFSLALEHHASGCITALANLRSTDLRKVWDAYQMAEKEDLAQERLRAIRAVTDRFAPAPPTLKFLIANGFQQPSWSVRPPLLELSQEKKAALFDALENLPFDWRS